MPPVDSERLDLIFHALADSTRRTILEDLMKRDEQTLFEICVRLLQTHRLELTRQAISKHLAVLENAGLIETEWKGRSKTHSCQLGDMRRLIGQWLTQIESAPKKRNS